MFSKSNHCEIRSPNIKIGIGIVVCLVSGSLPHLASPYKRGGIVYRLPGGQPLTRETRHLLRNPRSSTLFRPACKPEAIMTVQTEHNDDTRISVCSSRLLRSSRSPSPGSGRTEKGLKMIKKSRSSGGSRSVPIFFQHPAMLSQ
jgi:hypothetical protein